MESPRAARRNASTSSITPNIKVPLIISIKTEPNLPNPISKPFMNENNIVISVKKEPETEKDSLDVVCKSEPVSPPGSPLLSVKWEANACECFREPPDSNESSSESSSESSDTPSDPESLPFRGFPVDCTIENQYERFKSFLNRFFKSDPSSVKIENYPIKKCYVRLSRCDGNVNDSSSNIPSKQKNVCSIRKRRQLKDKKSQGKKFECLECCQVFVKALHLRRHILTHSRSQPTVSFAKMGRPELHSKAFICNVCGQGYTTSYYLGEHMLIHSKTPPTCHICNKVVGSKISLRLHLKLHENRPRSFLCHICNKSFTSQQTVKNHQQIHTKPFHCTLCPKSFSYKSYRELHMRSHDGKQRHKCTKCGEAFYEKRDLLVHQQRHFPQGFTCAHCNRVFPFKNNLILHVKKHLSREKTRMPCSICNKTFMKAWCLKMHKKTHKLQQCDSCDFVSSDLTSLRTHEAIAHGAGNTHPCTICNRLTYSAKALEVHEARHMTIIKQHKCPHCQSKYVRSKGLERHITKMHSVVLNCDFCSKSLRCPNMMKRHRLIHTKPVQCAHCPLTFSFKVQVKRHISRVHASSVTVVQFPCRICAKVFHDIPGLRNHHKVHTKPFKCNKCDQGFSVKTLLKYHQEIHATEKKVQCDLCNKSFSSRFSMNYHRKNHVPRYCLICQYCNKGHRSNTELAKHIELKHTG